MENQEGTPAETRYYITTRPHYNVKFWGGKHGWTYHKERAHFYKTLAAADGAVKRNRESWARHLGYTDITIKAVSITPARGIVAGKEPTTMTDNNNVSTPKPNPIQEARRHAVELEARMNKRFPGGVEERQLYEDRPFKEGMLAASIAQAEELRRIADMLEGYLAIHADPAVLSGLATDNEGDK